MIYVHVRVKPVPGHGWDMLQTEMAEYNRLIEKDGGKAVGNFVVRIGDGSGDHIHLFAYEDMAAYATAMEKMGSDPEWQNFLARTGQKVNAVDISVLRPVAESALQ